ncbi:MAG TPA: ABC transporter permease [Candidatus Sulfomarinibacteraceae bacterium]|nr:ABC transporter permease [Candidatus Sulfomarinibacteraceae bacterium]
MRRYLLKRLGMSLLVAFLATVFLASMIHFIPGDPVKTLLGPRATEERSAEVRAAMGLDDPIPVQVYNFTRNIVLYGDLGEDFSSHRPVTDIIARVLPHTLALAASSLLIAAVFGIPLGVYSATRPNTLADRITSIFAVSFITLPSYVASLLLLLLFAVQLKWFPAIGVGDPGDPVDYLRHLVLPATALAITWVGYLARLVRASMLEILNANYIRTAMAYGLRDRTIFYKYALRNAIIPTVAVLGVGLGNLLGGAVFTEVIFSRPGLGRLIYDAISGRNYPIVRGGILVAALLFVFANLIADLSYHYLDPRIRAEGGRS